MVKYEKNTYEWSGPTDGVLGTSTYRTDVWDDSGYKVSEGIGSSREEAEDNARDNIIEEGVNMGEFYKTMD